jgi:hypothetical protein
MMRFTMFSVASTAYQEVAELCVPSWRWHAGAEKVEVFSYDDSRHSANIPKQWKTAQPIRARAWAGAVQNAVATGVPVVLMDVDCMVLDSIAEGFDGTHPLAVARWPIINIGVLFVDVRIPFPFVAFFNDFAARVEAVPRERLGATTDQDIMQEKLHDHEEFVNKLSYKWNLTFDVRHGTKRKADYPDPRIIHLHWYSYRSAGIAGARSRLEPLFPKAFGT